MKEHPIPQDITNYRFHIVGSMTLKQFGEVAIGVALSFFVYQTNLPIIIKWPIIILLFGGGLASAFVPIEERPLSHWITTFIKILYKPTQFFWKRVYNIPAPFLFKGNEEHLLQLKEIDLSPARRQRIKEFLSSTKTKADEDPFFVTEQTKIDSIMGIFSTQPVVSVTTTTRSAQPVIEKPHLTAQPRSMREFQPPKPTSGVIVPENRPTINSLDQPLTLDSTIVFESDTVRSSPQKKNSFLDTEEVAQELQIPEIQGVIVGEKDDSEDLSVLYQQQNNAGERAYVEQAGEIMEPASSTERAFFNKNLPFPTKPNVPNKLVGMVLTPNNEIISGAIVEIKPPNGHVTRAVKTNALGQFFITTPLENGTYVVEVDKENMRFQAVEITLRGNLVDPIEIRSLAL